MASWQHPAVEELTTFLGNRFALIHARGNSSVPSGQFQPRCIANEVGPRRQDQTARNRGMHEWKARANLWKFDSLGWSLYLVSFEGEREVDDLAWFFLLLLFCGVGALFAIFFYGLRTWMAVGDHREE